MADEVCSLLVALDANILDRTGLEQDHLIERLEGLALHGRIDLFWPRGVIDEMIHVHAPEPIRTAARAARARAPVPLSARQHIDRIRVRAILRGDGRAGKHDADASHLSEAAEAGCGTFLTRDSKILRKRETLAMALPDGMRIQTLAEFCTAMVDGLSQMTLDKAVSTRSLVPAEDGNDPTDRVIVAGPTR